jgi:hypothetical protein
MIVIANGTKFDNLIVLNEGERQPYKTSSRTHRTFDCKCIFCGAIINCRMDKLRVGRVKSCGCTKIIHGEHNSRLHRCWCDMKRRAKARKHCTVCLLWKSFQSFKEWALTHGYEETLVLCRNGDIGDYAPDNVRWDTKGNNTLEYYGKL